MEVRVDSIVLFVMFRPRPFKSFQIVGGCLAIVPGFVLPCSHKQHRPDSRQQSRTSRLLIPGCHREIRDVAEVFAHAHHGRETGLGCKYMS